jgi:hypothetical protein
LANTSTGKKDPSLFAPVPGVRLIISLSIVIEKKPGKGLFFYFKLSLSPAGS